MGGRTAARGSAYEDNRTYVLAVLGRRCRWLTPDEAEVMLHEAWAILLEKEHLGDLDVATMRPAQVRAYVLQTAINKALDEGKRARRTREESLGERDDFVAPSAPPEDVVDAVFERARVREIVGELTARQQTIVRLRFFLDRSPKDIQRLLGITERAYRRDLERAMRVVSMRYELVRTGRFCESRASLIRAYIAGIAGPNRAREAREHLATCPACTRWAFELREASGQLTMTSPVAAAEVPPRPLGQVMHLLPARRDHCPATPPRAVALSPTAARR